MNPNGYILLIEFIKDSKVRASSDGQKRILNYVGDKTLFGLKIYSGWFEYSSSILKFMH